MDDQFDKKCILGDTGFRQPPASSTRESVGDVCLDEDLPELEDTDASGGIEILGRKLEKGERLPQEKNEEQLESEKDKREERFESEKEKREERFESEKERREERIQDEKEEKEEQIVTKEQRQELFKEAKALQEADQLDEAVHKFTAALSGVRPETAFPELPVCLRSLAEIYYKGEEYEKAVHFVQAEKMYYEAALLDTSLLQSILNKDVTQSLIEGKDDLQLQKLRANEYETLARFCVGKMELALALEYAAKAAKLREAVFGPDHEVTIQSLDYMTSIYADLGKKEYAESLEKFERSKEGPTAESNGNGPKTLLSGASVGQPQEGQSFDREVRISLFFFAVMVFIAFAVLTCVSAYAYCKLTISPMCELGSSILTEQLSWLHFHFYKLFL